MYMDDDGGAGVGEKRERVTRVARRVYVGNLSWTTSWQNLKDHFGAVGSVRYADVMREAGPGSRSKGCGIVEFEAPEEAARAILELTDTELDGRRIFVREDREDHDLKADAEARGEGGSDAGYWPTGPKRANRGGFGGGGGGGGGGGAVTVGRRVYVGNLAYETGWQELKDHFKQAGNVLHADVLTAPEGGSKGCGVVEFSDPSEALHAISLLSNSMLGGRSIMVREDREDPRMGRPAPGGRGSGRGGGFGRGLPADLGIGGGGGAPAGGTQIVVHGLPYSAAWQELKDLAREAAGGAQVVRADVKSNPDGSSKGWGVVAFASPQDAQAAIQGLNGREHEGRVLTAKLDAFTS